MSDQGSGGDNAPGEAIAKQARARQGRDKELVEAAREGDRSAFGKLYDAWVDHVYDRAIHDGASAAEAREVTEQTFLTVWHNLGRLRQPAAIGAKILQVAQRQGSTRVRGTAPAHHPTGTPGDAEDRLTRTTDAANAAADPDVAAVLRDASLALDDRTREVLDLHYRQGLTASEVGAVLHIDADSVKETIAKLPTALGVLTRARVLWRGGQPLDDELAQLLEEQQITTFDATTVRTINRFAKDHDRARARSMIAVAPIELYAAIPLAAAPAGLKMTVAELLVTEGVPMDGSAFVKRDERGEIIAKPKDKRGDEVGADVKGRPGPTAAPALDKKAAAVAAAALAAEAVALAEGPPADAVAAPDDARKSKVSERFRARKSTPAPVAAAAVIEPAGAEPTALLDGPDHSGPGGTGGGDEVGGALGGWSSTGLDPAPVSANGGGGSGAYGTGPTPEDLDARAEGEAAAMGRAYTRPVRDGDGSDRVIPGAAHLDTDDAGNRKKALVIGGAVAAGVILFGGLAFALKGGGDETRTVADGPRPTNPQSDKPGAVTTTLPATTTTVIATTTEPAPTTTAAPDAGGGDGGPSVTEPVVDGGGGSGAPTGGGNNPAPPPPAPTPTAPVTQPRATIAQATTGGFGWGSTETNRVVNYPMADAPVLSWSFSSSGPLTVSIYNGGQLLGQGLAAADSLRICPTNTFDAGACIVPAGIYNISVVIFGSDGSYDPNRQIGFQVK